MGKRMDAGIPGNRHADAIRRTAIVALLADEALMDQMLRGGQAMGASLPLQQAAAMQEGQDPPAVLPRLEHALQSIFALQGYRAFDTRLLPMPSPVPGPVPGPMPRPLPGSMAGGPAPLHHGSGHRVEFRLLPRRQADLLQGDLRRMRREALSLGDGARLTIDISDRPPPLHEPDSGVIHVHAPLARVCEKLRAICQQMPAYRRFILRAGPGMPRAGDFVAIEALARGTDLALDTPAARQMLELAFFAQCVPLELVSGIPLTRSFHEPGFARVRAALGLEGGLRDFGHYFSAVVDVVRRLGPPLHR